MHGRFKTALQPCAQAYTRAPNDMQRPRPSNLGNKASSLECSLSPLAPNGRLGIERAIHQERVACLGFVAPAVRFTQEERHSVVAELCAVCDLAPTSWSVRSRM